VEAQVAEELKVGDTIYRFDEYRRVYKRDENGRASGGPIYREHFMPVKITGEGPRSWTRCTQPSDYYTAQSVEDAVFVHCHGYKIRALIDRCNAAELRKIAEIIGYQPEPEEVAQPAQEEARQ
jgi:hypothetical protein